MKVYYSPDLFFCWGIASLVQKIMRKLIFKKSIFKNDAPYHELFPCGSLSMELSSFC